MTDRQILGFMAFVQVMLAICGIVELRRAAGLFKAGIEFVALQREPCFWLHVGVWRSSRTVNTIKEEEPTAQMKELGEANGGLDVANVLAHRGDGTKISTQMLQKTAQSQTMVFTIPANFSNDHENSHKGDQIIYVLDGKATARVSGKEQEIKAGDLLMIPAGAPHTLRTGSESLFAFTIFAPPEA